LGFGHLPILHKNVSPCPGKANCLIGLRLKGEKFRVHHNLEGMLRLFSVGVLVDFITERVNGKQ